MTKVRLSRTTVFALIAGLAACGALIAQETVGAITGTVKDSSGAAVPSATVKAVNIATNLEIVEHTDANGSYEVPNIPAGTYKITFSKEGFETSTHTEVLVNTSRTTTVDGTLKVGAVTTTVDVTDVSLMNQVDTTVGYVVDQLTIESTPLGTGSFTQLAIMSPGVHADFLSGAGANAGLGNQAIFANGQRATSNSFAVNGVDTNNLFNGQTTSAVGENRFVLNTGESFGAGGAITTTSIYTAIGQSLPTPPVEAIQEIAVNTSMYDATQGAHSGAHISVITKGGGNAIHGALSETFGNSDLSAAAFFYNASPAITTKVPFFNRNQFVAAVGGPIKKDKLFYFLSYQGVRVSDAYDATKDVSVPLALTNDRSTQGIINTLQATYGGTFTASQLSAPAVALLQQKAANGSFFIPTPSITNAATAKALGYDAVLQGPNATANVDQGIADIDYVVNDKDRLSAKYYVQQNPSTNPFAPSDSLFGFGQNLNAGSQVESITNTVILKPTLTWTQKVGFTRMFAYANDGQAYTANQFGINLFGNPTLPQITISDIDPSLGSNSLGFGNSQGFGNEGMFQNQFEYGTSFNWVKGRHTFALGVQIDNAQLNVLNHNTNTDTLAFTNFENFAEGVVRTGSKSEEFSGSASRYYRSTTAGMYINDNWKMRSNLTVTLGLRWDFEGPLTEKYGRLTAFNPSLYSYNATTDTITNSGLEVAANNAQFGTPGAGDSLLKQHQYGFAPRLGIAYSPMSKLTIRTGFGIYYDRGELFSEFSPSAGGGYNGPFGVTLAQPFVQPVEATTGATLANPFGTAAPPTPAGSAAQFTALLPGLAQTISGKFPTNNLFGPFLYGGYDINNKLPYTVNWSFDVQYQFSNSWLFSVGYVGNHGTHEVLPIPFNEPGIATASNPINSQTSSYGVNQSKTATTPILTSEFAGNAPVRVPYIGYDMNSVTYNAEGISNYDALQVQVRKRISKGLMLTASYTWSHSLDEQSGEGLFFTGNNGLSPKGSYASSDFDQTHVFLVNYSYQLPNATSNRMLGYALNGWSIGGQTVAQSGEPYSVYDYSGSVGSLYFGTDIELLNPIVPLAPGATAASAQLQGTTGVNAGKPVLNVAAFQPQFVTPGTFGVPAGDIYESNFSSVGRNIFRGPFQVRFDTSLAKQFLIRDKYRLRLNFNVYNLFNHPDFDAPNNDVTFFAGFAPPPLATPEGSLGFIQHTIGSPRFMELSAHFTF